MVASKNRDCLARNHHCDLPPETRSGYIPCLFSKENSVCPCSVGMFKMFCGLRQVGQVCFPQLRFETELYSALMGWEGSKYLNSKMFIYYNLSKLKKKKKKPWKETSQLDFWNEARFSYFMNLKFSPRVVSPPYLKKKKSSSSRSSPFLQTAALNLPVSVGKVTGKLKVNETRFPV